MWRGSCPRCGVKINLRSSSIGTVKRCQNCGEKFIVKKKGCGCGCLMWILIFAVVAVAVEYLMKHSH